MRCRPPLQRRRRCAEGFPPPPPSGNGRVMLRLASTRIARRSGVLAKGARQPQSPCSVAEGSAGGQGGGGARAVGRACGALSACCS
eukprot:scaffold10307_cov120-Isochrysis_galbana.AAC.2